MKPGTTIKRYVQPPPKRIIRPNIIIRPSHPPKKIIPSKIHPPQPVFKSIPGKTLAQAMGSPYDKRIQIHTAPHMMGDSLAHQALVQQYHNIDARNETRQIAAQTNVLRDSLRMEKQQETELEEARTKRNETERQLSTVVKRVHEMRNEMGELTPLEIRTFEGMVTKLEQLHKNKILGIEMIQRFNGMIQQGYQIIQQKELNVEEIQPKPATISHHNIHEIQEIPNPFEDKRFLSNVLKYEQILEMNRLFVGEMVNVLLQAHLANSTKDPNVIKQIMVKYGDRKFHMGSFDNMTLDEIRNMYNQWLINVRNEYADTIDEYLHLLPIEFTSKFNNMQKAIEESYKIVREHVADNIAYMKGIINELQNYIEVRVPQEVDLLSHQLMEYKEKIDGRIQTAQKQLVDKQVEASKLEEEEPNQKAILKKKQEQETLEKQKHHMELEGISRSDQ